MIRPAVFLDRDGTIIEDAGYLSDAAALVLLPGAAAAIRRLNQAGLAVVVVTNQSGVARGLFTEQAVQDVHAALSVALAREAAVVDAFYYCPHHPDGEIEAYRVACGCRKPAAGLLHGATRDLGLDLARSWLVGDKQLDVDCGVAAGCRTILVRTGKGAAEERSAGRTLRADAILNNLMEAAEWILLNSSR